MMRGVRDHLAEIRAAVFEDASDRAGPASSQGETAAAAGSGLSWLQTGPRIAPYAT